MGHEALGTRHKAKGKRFVENRYLRNRTTITVEEQKTLSEKKVAIVGCGGLGQYVASLLCRIGIGQLTIIDDDVFDETNLNRQLYCLTGNLGLSKVFETEKHLKQINPHIRVISCKERFNAGTGELLLKDCDVVIDALDSVPDRLKLESECKSLNLPLISAAVGGWYGQLALILPGDDTLQKTYSKADEMGIRAEFECPAFTPACVASLQATETVKYLLGKSSLKRGKMLYIDLLNMMFFWEHGTGGNG